MSLATTVDVSCKRSNGGKFKPGSYSIVILGAFTCNNAQLSSPATYDIAVVPPPKLVVRKAQQPPSICASSGVATAQFNYTIMAAQTAGVWLVNGKATSTNTGATCTVTVTPSECWASHWVKFSHGRMDASRCFLRHVNTPHPVPASALAPQYSACLAMQRLLRTVASTCMHDKQCTTASIRIACCSKRQPPMLTVNCHCSSPLSCTCTGSNTTGLASVTCRGNFARVAKSVSIKLTLSLSQGRCSPRSSGPAVASVPVLCCRSGASYARQTAGKSWPPVAGNDKRFGWWCKRQLI